MAAELLLCVQRALGNPGAHPADVTAMLATLVPAALAQRPDLASTLAAVCGCVVVSLGATAAGSNQRR